MGTTGSGADRQRDASGRCPADFGYVTDAAQKTAQEKLASPVSNARQITKTNSGHEIHKEQPQLVIDAIVNVLDAVRAGKTSLAQ